MGRLIFYEVGAMERVIQDVRYGIRSLLKSRRFALAAVATLALGIGANTAMFSVIHAVLLQPWPFKDPARLLAVSQRQANGNQNLFSTQDFLDWKQQGGLLAKMGAHVSWQFNLSSAEEEPERIRGGMVSYDMLPVLGVQPMLGRLFSAEEDIAGSGNFVVLSYALWRDRYRANPRIPGTAIQLNGVPYTVVGVMPAAFHYFDNKELLWTPLQLRRDAGIGASPTFHWLGAFVRLPDGVTLQQTRAELDGVAGRLHREDATSDVGWGVYLQSINDAFTNDVRPALLMLMGCVGFVLLIACVNVANLALARGTARRREMAVRAALGASPLRVVRQLLTESVLLAMTGGALGIGFAFLALRAMLAMHPPSAPRMEVAGIDGAVLAYSLLVSVVIGILFGLAPAVEAARVDVNNGLREQGGSRGRGFGRQRSMLVITETALACMLLIGTGLALKSLWSLRSVELGFVPENVLTFRVAAPSRLTGDQIPEFYRRVAERIQAVPGVQSVAVARNLPMSGTDPSMPIVVEGKASAPAEGEIVTRHRAISPDYFRALQIPLLQGRAFDQRDTANAPAVAVVSESLARKYWPGESPVGKRLKPNFSGSVWCTVVGVAGDVRHWGADVDIEPTAYYPYTQIPDTIRQLLEADMGIAIRSSLGQSDLLRSIRSGVADVDKNLPVYEVKTMDAMVADSSSLRRFDVSLLATFSVLALSLAVIGVYAVMSYSVSQRTKEIGIRIALGAGSRDVLRLILDQAARLALAGVLIGVAGAFFLRRILASFLYGLSANDPVILLSVPLVMVFVVLLACYLPARRAAKIDPLVALRYE
jgi:putative ABC transport system permease protein